MFEVRVDPVGHIADRARDRRHGGTSLSHLSSLPLSVPSSSLSSTCPTASRFASRLSSIDIPASSRTTIVNGLPLSQLSPSVHVRVTICSSIARRDETRRAKHV